MTILDNRLNRTLFVFNNTPAQFIAGNDSLAVNIDATYGQGALIFGFDGLADMAAADLATMLNVNVYILRNSIITTQSIAAQFDITRYEIMHFSSSEDIGDRVIHRDFALPFPLPKGSRYTILFIPNTPAPANNYSLYFTVRGEYMKDENQGLLYGQAR
jgi:hypothetical protein